MKDDMGKEVVYIIIASQDFDSANHKNLWLEMAEQSGNEVLVANISADYITCYITRKKYRIKEAKSAPMQFAENLKVIRPLLLIRQELLPQWLFCIARKGFWNSIKKADPEIMDKQVKVVVYNAAWVKILKGSHPNMKIAYYLFDEVRYKDNECHIDKKTYFLDEIACKDSDVVFTMTNVLAKSRLIYNSNIIVLGNGSVYQENIERPEIRFKHSVAFVGVFRDWIDKELLSELIRVRHDLLFVFVGSINPDMQQYFYSLLNNFDNTVYYGMVPKERMPQLYKCFDGVIIPYKKNAFIQATRPIKIVESVLSGTPVVTMPMDGYDQCTFIRFANTVEDFSREIDYILGHPIMAYNTEYQNFVVNNTWKTKAQMLLNNL